MFTDQSNTPNNRRCAPTGPQERNKESNPQATFKGLLCACHPLIHLSACLLAESMFPGLFRDLDLDLDLSFRALGARAEPNSYGRSRALGCLGRSQPSEVLDLEGGGI